MEFKSINNFRMKWFGVDEIRNLEEVQDKLPFINGFSFGPFVPYYLYHFFHNIWDMYILQMAASFVMVWVYVFGYYISLFFAIFKSTISTVKNLTMESGYEPFDFYNQFGSSFTPLIIITIVFLLLFFAVDIGLRVYTGKHSRKLSWNRCEWQSYEAFEQGEKNWHIAGIIFFVLQMLSLLFVILLIIFAFFFISTFLPSLKEMVPTDLQQSFIPQLFL